MNDPASASPSRDSRESTAKTDGSRAARRRRTSAARRALCLLAALVCIAINALALLRGFGRGEKRRSGATRPPTSSSAYSARAATESPAASRASARNGRQARPIGCSSIAASISGAISASRPWKACHMMRWFTCTATAFGSCARRPVRKARSIASCASANRPCRQARRAESASASQTDSGTRVSAAAVAKPSTALEKALALPRDRIRIAPPWRIAAPCSPAASAAWSASNRLW